MSSEAIQVTVFDPNTGESDYKEIPPGDYVVIAHEPCHVDGVQAYSNGTHVLTIKGRTRP